MSVATAGAVAPDANRDIQAWGHDDAGRRQYIYSEPAVRARDHRKWNRVLRYARRVPLLRAATHAHLQGERLDVDKVLATVVRLMIRGHFRVGSERYAVQNRTFGIATLKKSHLSIEGEDLLFTYHGKLATMRQHIVVLRRASSWATRLRSRAGRTSTRPFSTGTGSTAGHSRACWSINSGRGRIRRRQSSTIRRRRH